MGFLVKMTPTFFTILIGSDWSRYLLISIL